MKIIANILFSDEQAEKYQVWRKSLPEPTEEDIDCCMTGCAFTIIPSGIGDTITVESRGSTCDLSIDDDGFLCIDHDKNFNYGTRPIDIDKYHKEMKAARAY